MHINAYFLRLKFQVTFLINLVHDIELIEPDAPSSSSGEKDKM